MDLSHLKVGIVGGGTVGAAMAKAWEGHVEAVLVFDVRPERANSLLREVLRCDLVFVCLPTPQRGGSLECDTSAVDTFFSLRLGSVNLEPEARHRNFVLKSTVPIGYTRKAAKDYCLPNLVHSPEFLTARTAVEDAANPTRLVIGDPSFEHHKSRIDNKCTGILHRISEVRWPGVKQYVMSSDESEAVKLAQNAHSAVEVSWWNELMQLCEERKLNFESVRAAVLAGGWICPKHSQVPGPDGKRGWGGSCLPKDLANWVSCFSGECPVSRGALERNKVDRSRE